MSTRERLPGTPAPGECWTASHGLRLCGDSFGPEHGQQIILLHGGGQNRHAWHKTAQRLGDAGYRAITVDARGHGDSDWSPSGDYTLDAFVADLVELVGLLGDRQPVLIGASLGGLAALAAVGEDQVRVKGLVLVDVAPRTERAGSDRVKAFLERHTQGFASLDEVADAVAAFRPGATPRGNRDSISRNVRRAADGRLYWHWDPRFLDGREHDLATRYQRLAPAARSLTGPTLLVRGASSDVVSEEGANDFLALCPHAEYVNILNAGHMVTGDVNDVFGQATLAFLARVAG